MKKEIFDMNIRRALELHKRGHHPITLFFQDEIDNNQLNDFITKNFGTFHSLEMKTNSNIRLICGLSVKEGILYCFNGESWNREPLMIDQNDYVLNN